MPKKKTVFRGNKYEALSQPQARLDFHGLGLLTKEEICEKAKDFIESCWKKNLKRVLIITGKGLHSKEGPVIGPLLIQYLPTLPFVQTVFLARRDRGGEGALEVELV